MPLPPVAPLLDVMRSPHTAAARSRLGACASLSLALSLLPAYTLSQPAVSDAPPVLRVGATAGDIRLDGRLDEPAWLRADSIGAITQLEPVAGATPAARTVIRVLASAHEIVVGIRADDPDPSHLVSFARERDAALGNEDHVKIVLDTYLDGRSGYVFAVNPNGARYDALVSGQGASENANWDTPWEAATARTATGWSVEIRIPTRSLLFRPGLETWGFNVQRRLQRLQETDRWASPQRDYQISQTSRAGRLTGLPDFALGVGLTVRPSISAGTGVPAPKAAVRTDHDASLDATQLLGANTLASLTINTDFAETEVDTRRTNLTRFPLVFPEKRTFFLQGADIFDFGLGANDDVRPFFSRRIGLLSGNEVPIRAGAKVNGRAGGSSYGALVVRTGHPNGVGLDTLATANTLGVLRLKQNVLRESYVGMIATAGDPLGRHGAWTLGGDATYQTSRFRGDKNLVVGGWLLGTDRAGLTGERRSWGAKLDYPNDLVDAAFTFKRIGDGFDPSLGFVPRAGAQIYALSATYQPRPTRRIAGLHVRQMFHELEPSLVTDLGGRWESWRVFTAPVNYRLESGDRFELNWAPAGERLTAPFEIADGVTIPAGTYHWTRYRVEGGLAAKRRVSGQATWWFGNFYTGHLDELRLTTAWKPSSLFIMELNGTRNIGRLREGRFTQDLVGTRVRVNVSPDLQINSYAQYDNESDTFGANTRLRWTFSTLGDLFVVYNHNLRHDIDAETGLPLGASGPSDPARGIDRRWGFASNQLLVKVQYAVRY